MRELRRDPLTGRWVVLSTDRVPPSFLPADLPNPAAGSEGCPFCPGNERATGQTLAQVERDGRWVARAFPNIRPALVIEEELRHRGEGPYDRVSGTGAHEVVVECRAHHEPLVDQPARQLADALGLAASRMRDLAKDRRFQSLVWFRNHGAAAGATQAHPHAQIVALPVVPPLLQATLDRSRRWREERGRDLLQDLLDHDRERGDRVVWEGDRVVAVCPWAPSVPFETWLLPVGPGARLSQGDPRLIDELAVAMREVLSRLGQVLGRPSEGGALQPPAYQAVLHEAPVHGDHPGFRWHLRILPQLVAPGGLQAATGGALHWVFPEEAAAALRR